MLHGDLSNQRGFVIGFRAENSLLIPREKKFTDKVANFFVRNKYKRATLNKPVISLAKFLYWNTEMNTALVIDDWLYQSLGFEFFGDLPFSHIYNILSLNHVSMMLATGELSYYVDDCTESRYKVQSEYAVSSEEFSKIFRFRGKLRPFQGV